MHQKCCQEQLHVINALQSLSCFKRDQQITRLYTLRFTPTRTTFFYRIPKKTQTNDNKKTHSISDFPANLLPKPCTNLMAGDFLQVTSLQKTAMSGGGSEAPTWKNFWIVPPPAGRWAMITSPCQVASCSFLSSRCQMWQIIRGGILVWSFVCWDWSVSSKLIYFQIS